MDYVGVRLALELCGIPGTSGDTQPAANTPLAVHHRHPILFSDGLDLASRETDFTSLTFLRINDRVVVGVGYRVLDAPIGDAPQDSTAATTTVTDVAEPLHDVAHRMHQANRLGFIV